jgi:hypothetical protein
VSDFYFLLLNMDMSLMSAFLVFDGRRCEMVSRCLNLLEIRKTIQRQRAYWVNRPKQARWQLGNPPLVESLPTCTFLCYADDIPARVTDG